MMGTGVPGRDCPLGDLLAQEGQRPQAGEATGDGAGGRRAGVWGFSEGGGRPGTQGADMFAKMGWLGGQ